ncbi:MAG: hypothetical protein RJB13_2328 [Pseudomonadota bacterium]
MAWLDTIKELSFVLQSVSCNWICFFKYETDDLFDHPTAVDHSLNGSRPGARQQGLQESRVSCFFALQPHVDCCEFSAESFFAHPAVRVPSPGCFLIPYYSEDGYSAQSQSPFLKLGYSDWVELSGHPDTDTPTIRSSGDLLRRIVKVMSEHVAQNTFEELLQKPDLNLTESPQLWQSTEDPESLLDMFESLKARMRMGDCYLANGTTRLIGPARSQLTISLSQFVSQWISAPSRYGVYFNGGDKLPLVVCFSPERFIRRSGHFVQAEPIKGTSPTDPTQSDFGASMLWKSTKEMCEQKMVTDLLRNDLNKVCEPGTVYVESPYQVRIAGSLLQMQSVVQGTLSDKYLANSDILMKTLPAGSVTGTPKYAVGQLIAQVEKTERGYYTGVFARCEGADEFDSTILIRGFFADSNNWYTGVGAGITTLSDSVAEAAEFELKWSSFASRLNSNSSTTGSCMPVLTGFKSTSLWNQIFNHAALTPQQHSKGEVSHLEPSVTSVPIKMNEVPSGLLIEIADFDELLNLSGVPGSAVLFVDHFDSFSENLIAALRSLGLSVVRIFSAPHSHPTSKSLELGALEPNRLSVSLGQNFDGVVFSPGPGVPSDYVLSQTLLRSVPNKLPVLGVCLGHQLMLTESGLTLERVSETPVHGRNVLLTSLQNSRLLNDASFSGEATFYNSWQVMVSSLGIEGCPWYACGLDGAGIVLCEHSVLPRIAVQFHPESFATQSGRSLLGAFVDLTSSYKINSQANVAQKFTQTAKVGL